MLHILGNIDTQIESFNFYMDVEEPIRLYCKANESLGKPSTFAPRINFNDIEIDLNIIVDNWFNKTDFHSSIDLILEKTSNNQLSRENYFLNNCFSIETFHRRFQNYNLFEPSDFKIIKKQILESIEDENIRSLIENNLAHLNQPNFRKRLFAFSSDLTILLPSNLDIDSYIRKIVKTRNYLVHRSSDKNTFDKFDLLYSAIFLEALVKINVYRILGINESVVETLLTETGRRIQGFYESNKRR